jgi:mono/diheme cytochrome c family protein
MRLRLIPCLLIMCAVPTVYAFSGIGDQNRGKMIFMQRCSVCHGEDGRGRDGMAADLVGEWQRLTKSDEELSHNIRSGKLHTAGKIYTAGQCPPQVLDDRDMNDVLAYLRNAYGATRFNFER